MKKDLPSNKAARAKVLRAAMNIGMSYRAPLSMEWAMTYWYMQGIRNFQITDYRQGRFRWSYESPDGELQVKIEDTVKQYQRQLGLVQKINVQPLSKPKGLGLESMRKAAVGQVAMDYIVGCMSLNKIHMDASQLALIYGCGALVASVNPEVSLLGMRPRISTAPPWQILSDPARPMRREEVTGIFWQRWVPFRWAKEHYKDRINFPAEGEAQLNLRNLQLGDRIDTTDDYTGTQSSGGLGQMAVGVGSNSVPRDDDEPWVELTEYWNYNDHDCVEQYEVLLGDWIATKDSFKDASYSRQPCLPIGMFGGQITGSFFNRGWVPLLIPNNVELEKMISSLYKNVKEDDQNRWLTVPNTGGYTREQIQESQGRPKILFYEPDYQSPHIKPEMLEFRSSGDAPGRVAMTAIQLADRLGNASDLFNGKAPGRVDSASGLGLLYETVGIQSIPMASTFNHAYTTVYRALLQQAGQLLKGKKTLPLLSLDDNLAGVVIDEATGEMAFDERNPLPKPDEINLSIRDQQPKMQEQQRQDLMAMKQAGQIDPIEFAWYNYQNNLELPAGFETEVEEIRKCKYRNIIQWNDGKIPGGVQPSTLDMHAIHMKWMKRFMAQPIFQFADKNVRDAFEQRYHFHEAGLGGFPDGIPYPEDMGDPANQPQPDQWGQAGSIDPGQLPPQMAKMMASAPPDGVPQEGMQ